ncbi:hypothetical protein [Streptomyces sp. SID5789]|uniref:hypothetical protein n=1 Tax=Streptomyces sp. SID5789 TaxID=2690310 RepID=UPI001926609C|nr:hypothetical protein [Streptomyces sp. SID5789]
MTGGLDVHAAVAKFDRGSVTEAESAAEDEQKQVLARFPLEEWAELPLNATPSGRESRPGRGRRANRS